MSVLAMLDVKAWEKEQALSLLKKISVEAKGAQEFAERVLNDFTRPQL